MALTRAFTTSQLDSRVDFYYTATSGQTTFSGSDDNSLTLSYTASGKKDVYLNGTLLIESDDYVATNGTSVVLQATTQAGDIVHISVNKVMSSLVNLVDTAVDLNGNELILDADGDTSITADTDDVIDVKVGGNDNIEINALGASRKLKVYKGALDELVLQSNAPDASGNMRKIELEGENVIFSTGASGGTSTTLRHKISSDGDTNFYRDDGSTVAMKLDASNGNIGIGTTTVASALHVVDSGATPCIFDITGTTGDIVLLRNNGSTKGTISTNGSTVSYNTSSDYRLKENVDYSFDATARLKELKPCRFNWIADDTNTLLDGFIAHEVSSVVPEAVSGTKDETETYKDDNGDDQTRNKYQGIDQAKLVPLLVKTIQELEARITALENE